MYEEKLKNLCEKIRFETDERYKKQTPEYYERCLVDGVMHKVIIYPGRDYDRITLADADGTHEIVKYFVHKETERIIGAAGWKQKNFNREYGTLDTIDEWYWGEYYATGLHGQETLVSYENRLNTKS